MSLMLTLANTARSTRERLRLYRVPRQSCDTSPLRQTDAAWLEATFARDATRGEWPGVEQELGQLRISTTSFGVNPGDRRALFHLIRALNPGRVLEVGTNIGASTSHIAVGLRMNGPGGTLTTVDVVPVNDARSGPWVAAGSPFSPAGLMQQLGMAQRVEFVTMPSLEFLAGGGERFDLIFLDGDHAAATVYQELPAALSRLNREGVILLHDFFPQGRPLWPDGALIAGPWLAAERLRQEGARLEVVPLGDLPWPTKQGGRRTSLALVSRSA